MNKHHRKPRWYHGSDEKWNVISVDEQRHAAFHFSFRVKTGRGSGCRPMTPEEIGQDLTKTWIDPAYEIIVRAKNSPVHKCDKCQKWFDTNLICPVCSREKG